MVHKEGDGPANEYKIEEKCNNISTDLCNFVGAATPNVPNQAPMPQASKQLLNACMVPPLYIIITLLAGCQSSILSSNEWHRHEPGSDGCAGAAASECVTPRGVQPFLGVVGGGSPPPWVTQTLGVRGSGAQPPGSPEGGGGSVGTPTYIPQNDPHDTLIILNMHEG